MNIKDLEYLKEEMERIRNIFPYQRIDPYSIKDWNSFSDVIALIDQCIKEREGK